MGDGAARLNRRAAGPTLEPRDVIVMCPDIETFAPLIHAAFGAAAPADEDADDPDPRPRRRRPPAGPPRAPAPGASGPAAPADEDADDPDALPRELRPPDLRVRLAD